MHTIPNGIDFGFLKSVKMRDQYGLLKGNGKLMRVLPLKSFDKVIETYYFNQAIELTK